MFLKVGVLIKQNLTYKMLPTDMLTDSEKCDLQDIIYIPKQPVGPGVGLKSPFRELVKIR